MIKNDRQYRIAKAAAAKFEDALRGFDAAKRPRNVHPVIQRAEKDALRSQLDDLAAQIREYEDLSAGKVGVLELGSLADLPDALVRARIATGLTQKDLANRLGLKEQQIQRYEANDYQQASLARLLAVSEALNLHVRK